MNVEGIARRLPDRDEILQRLPDRDDLLRLLARRRSRMRSDDILSAVGLLGTGLLIGAGLALLFAPKSGRELRKQMSDRMEEARSSLGGESSERRQGGSTSRSASGRSGVA
jgi:hypothetical protein